MHTSLSLSLFSSPSVVQCWARLAGQEVPGHSNFSSATAGSLDHSVRHSNVTHARGREEEEEEEETAVFLKWARTEGVLSSEVPAWLLLLQAARLPKPPVQPVTRLTPGSGSISTGEPRTVLPKTVGAMAHIAEKLSPSHTQALLLFSMKAVLAVMFLEWCL